MRVDVLIKLIFFNIKINIRDITARLKDNNFFYFRIWEKRITMISFNFELSMIMLMSKQYDIKFVMMRKTSILDIKLALLHIIFKNDIVDKKRFNFVDKLISKPYYFDIFFDSNSTFSFDASRKINIDILNL